MPQGKDALRQQAGTEASGRDHVGPVGYANYTPHVTAPAGKTFGSDLPVNNMPNGMPFTTGGYSATPTRSPLPAGGTGGPADGVGKPPTGNRR